MAPLTPTSAIRIGERP